MRIILMHRFSKIGLILGMILLGLNLRPALAAISPLVRQIQQLSGMGDDKFALLTTIPVLLMGVVSLLLSRRRNLFSARLGCAIAMLLIASACLSRLFAEHATVLLFSSLIAGVGIAFTQVLLPGMIKTHFTHKISMVMGLYTTAIMAGAALASGITPIIADLVGTPVALASWALPAIIAGIMWYSVCPGRAKVQEQNVLPTINTQNTDATVRLCCLFGISTGAYTLMLAWLPAYYQQLGMSEIASGGLLSALTGTEILAGVLVSFLIGKWCDSRTALIVASVLLMLGLLLLLLRPVAWLYPCIVCLGLGIGALFPLSLIITLEHTRNGFDAELLSAKVQGTGYVIASVFPYIAGLLKGQMSDLSYAWWGMLALCLPLMMLVKFFFFSSNKQSLTFITK